VSELLCVSAFIAVVAPIVWLVKRAGAVASKKCPHCAENIKAAARVCRSAAARSETRAAAR
jgi:hypothetical protein